MVNITISNRNSKTSYASKKTNYNNITQNSRILYYIIYKMFQNFLLYAQIGPMNMISYTKRKFHIINSSRKLKIHLINTQNLKICVVKKNKLQMNFKNSETKILYFSLSIRLLLLLLYSNKRTMFICFKKNFLEVWDLYTNSHIKSFFIKNSLVSLTYVKFFKVIFATNIKTIIAISLDLLEFEIFFSIHNISIFKKQTTQYYDIYKSRYIIINNINQNRLLYYFVLINNGIILSNVTPYPDKMCYFRSSNILIKTILFIHRLKILLFIYNDQCIGIFLIGRQKMIKIKTFRTVIFLRNISIIKYLLYNSRRLRNDICVLNNSNHVYLIHQEFKLNRNQYFKSYVVNKNSFEYYISVNNRLSDFIFIQDKNKNYYRIIYIFYNSCLVFLEDINKKINRTAAFSTKSIRSNLLLNKICNDTFRNYFFISTSKNCILKINMESQCINGLFKHSSNINLIKTKHCISYCIEIFIHHSTNNIIVIYFDGSVKIWNINSIQLLKLFTINKRVIFAYQSMHTNLYLITSNDYILKVNAKSIKIKRTKNLNINWSICNSSLDNSSLATLISIENLPIKLIKYALLVKYRTNNKNSKKEFMQNDLLLMFTLAECTTIKKNSDEACSFKTEKQKYSHDISLVASFVANKNLGKIKELFNQFVYSLKTLSYQLVRIDKLIIFDISSKYNKIDYYKNNQNIPLIKTIFMRQMHEKRFINVNLFLNGMSFITALYFILLHLNAGLKRKSVIQHFGIKLLYYSLSSHSFRNNLILLIISVILYTNTSNRKSRQKKFIKRYLDINFFMLTQLNISLSVF